MSKNTKLLLIVTSIRKIIDIFLGPFLTAYLFKVSINNIQTISIYNIFSYTILALISLILGKFLKNKYDMEIFRLGVISRFILLVILIILGENIINYIWLFSIISGFSTAALSFPLNLCASARVPNN